MNKTAEKLMGFKYERKRIEHDKKLPALCPDYQPREGSEYCERAALCKNATYSIEGRILGTCYGGTKSTEREERKNTFDQRLNKIESKKKTKSNKK